MLRMSIITCIAPVNIAVIKYWGKRDEKLILPLNDSLSTTLSTKEMRATTSIMRSADFTEDRLWLNGREESFKNPRLTRCLLEIRKLAKATPEASWKVHVCSENNFPTAAGLASSAAGYACLVYTLAKVFGVEGDLTRIARQGSGSACRSLAGGFVCWERGVQSEGADSVAKQVFPADHWPSLRILILVVTEKKKKVSSTVGMQRSVDTSDLLLHRIRCCVPERIELIKHAIATKDFEKFGDITIRDSNQFHAIALDTYPPAIYMNDTSHAIAELVHAYNEIRGETKVAYTFDAGPNACLYMEDEDVAEVAALIQHTFPPTPGTKDTFFTGMPLKVPTLSQELREKFTPHEAGLLHYSILTELGTGPEQLTDPLSHLLTDDGFPKELKKAEPDKPLVMEHNSNRTGLGLEAELRLPKKVETFSPNESWLLPHNNPPEPGSTIECEPESNRREEEIIEKLILLAKSEREKRFPPQTGPETLPTSLAMDHYNDDITKDPNTFLPMVKPAPPGSEAARKQAEEDADFKKLLEQFNPKEIDMAKHTIRLSPEDVTEPLSGPSEAGASPSMFKE